MFRVKSAYEMPRRISTTDTGWHGRLAGSNIYIAAIYDELGLRVTTIERCLMFVPNESLSWTPSYEGMKAELSEHIKWPPRPIDGVPAGLSKLSDVVAGGPVVEALQNITGMDKEDIVSRISCALEESGAAERLRILPGPHDPGVPMVDGFSAEECREAHLSAVETGDAAPARPEKVFGEKSAIDLYNAAVSNVTGEKLRIVSTPAHQHITADAPRTYEEILADIDEELHALQQCMSDGEDDHNDDVLDEMHKLYHQRSVLLQEMEA